MERTLVTADVIAWYAAEARDLPWRRADVSPWGVVVSEFMLQQTPVARVLAPWEAWLLRWPTPSALAAEPAGEAVRAWGRLGYPRRAQRLHQAACLMVSRHAGKVPETLAELRALPGVGEYTAAAIASFAFGQRHVVLDTNVRRVLARVESGTEFPPASLGSTERALAERWLPEGPGESSRWGVAAMELGARLCTASTPACHRCPIAASCRWFALGRPPSSQPRRVQAWEGTDRQCRGVLLARLRTSTEGVARDHLLAAWPQDAEQAERALGSLLADGLIRQAAPDRWFL
ncbi:MAG: A/G-specific adenine glycosylase [Propionicimonas sp.]